MVLWGSPGYVRKGYEQVRERSGVIFIHGLQNTLLAPRYKVWMVQTSEIRTAANGQGGWCSN